MADGPKQEDKMATDPSDFESLRHTIRDNLQREDIDQSIFIRNPPEMLPKKKSGFQITSVRVRVPGVPDGDGDSMDDLDESHTEMSEDMSSDILDISKNTDIDQEPTSGDTLHNLNHEEYIACVSNEMQQKLDKANQQQTLPQNNPPAPTTQVAGDSTSRFKVVKLESSFKRGRWNCVDYINPPPAQKEKEVTETVGSGNSSAASSVNYVYGVDDPSSNPLGLVAAPQGQGVAAVQGDHQILEPTPVLATAATGTVRNGEYPPGGQVPIPNPNIPSSLAGVSQDVLIQAQSGSTINQDLSGYDNQAGRNVPLNKVPSQPKIPIAATSQSVTSVQPPGTAGGTVQSSIPQPENPDYAATGQEFLTKNLTVTFDSKIGQIPNQAPSEYNSTLPGNSNQSSINLAHNVTSDEFVGSGSAAVAQATGASQGGPSVTSSPNDENVHNTTELDLKLLEDKGGASRPDSIPVSDDSNNTESTSKERSAQTVLTPPLLEMVSATIQPPSSPSKEEGDDRYVISSSCLQYVQVINNL